MAVTDPDTGWPLILVTPFPFRFVITETALRNFLLDTLFLIFTESNILCISIIHAKGASLCILLFCYFVTCIFFVMKSIQAWCVGSCIQFFTILLFFVWQLTFYSHSLLQKMLPELSGTLSLFSDIWILSVKHAQKPCS